MYVENALQQLGSWMVDLARRWRKMQRLTARNRYGDTLMRYSRSVPSIVRRGSKRPSLPMIVAVDECTSFGYSFSNPLGYALGLHIMTDKPVKPRILFDVQQIDEHTFTVSLRDRRDMKGEQCTES